MVQRYGCSLFILLFAVAAQAQVRVVEMVCEPCPSTKLVQEVLTELDAQAYATGDATHLKARLNTSITDAQLFAFLNETLHCQVRGALTGNRQGITTTIGNAPPLPVRVDTGDPAADDAAFEAAKQAWRLANPEAHRALMQAQGRHIPHQP
jgi:hypothetical protein